MIAEVTFEELAKEGEGYMKKLEKEAWGEEQEDEE